jgi:predicted component of type VI protein secretion system
VEAQQRRVDTIEKIMKERDALHDLLADLPNKTSHQLMVRSSPQRP